MKSQLQSIGKRFTTLFETRKYATKPFRCDAHMNELPVPCGSWEIYYNDQQTWYSQCLVAGALWWLFSLSAMIYTDSIFFNFYPPCQPGPPSDMYVSECEEVK